MTVSELIDKLNRYLPNTEVMMQDSNGFIHDIDFVCTDFIDDVEPDIVFLVAGQLQSGGYEDTRID